MAATRNKAITSPVAKPTPPQSMSGMKPRPRRTASSSVV